jgi:hypothetical protein
MPFARVKAGLKLVGSPASGLLAGDVDPRFKIGEVGLEIKGGELGGNLGAVDGLFFPRFEPDAIGPHPLTAEESIGSHGVVADLSGPSTNFLQTFLADGIAQDRAATWRDVPVDGKIPIGFRKVVVGGGGCMGWNNANL